jgi:type VI secretion system Hcp family effector
MAFNAYLMFLTGNSDKIVGESTSVPVPEAENAGAMEITDFGFGVSMPVTTSRSDGGGATVGRANFDVFTCSKNIDTATCKLVEYCCKGTNIKKIVLHLFRQGEGNASGVVKYAQVIFQNCVITKSGISGGGEELPKESLEFNYGVVEYRYQYTDHDTGKPTNPPCSPAGAQPKSTTSWSTIKNKVEPDTAMAFDDFKVK